MSGSSDAWGSDVPISMPQPLAPGATAAGGIPMFGFIFTVDGLMHDLSQSDHERLSRSTYAPPQRPSATIRGDADLDDA